MTIAAYHLLYSFISCLKGSLKARSSDCSTANWNKRVLNMMFFWECLTPTDYDVQQKHQKLPKLDGSLIIQETPSPPEHMVQQCTGSWSLLCSPCSSLTGSSSSFNFKRVFLYLLPEIWQVGLRCLFGRSKRYNDIFIIAPQ